MRLIVALLLTLLVFAATAKQKSTTRHRLRPGMTALHELRRIALPADSQPPVSSPADFDSTVISIHSFTERAGDDREQFTATNNSSCHITGLMLLLRYYAADGSLIAERTVEVKCDIMPSKSQRLRIKSFDSNHAYHYAHGSRPRLTGTTPFDVAYRLLRYDVAITR